MYNWKMAALALTVAIASSGPMSAAEPANNKHSALAYYEALYAGKNTDKFIGENYVEHQQGSGYTRNGMLAKEQVDSTENVIHRVIAENNLVFLHVEQKQNGVTFARGDLFKFNDQGKIVEHWSTKQEAVPASKTKSGNSMFDGVTKVKPDSQLAVKFRDAHLAATDKIFNNANTDAVYASVTPEYIQHNPGGPNGPDGLVGTIKFLQSKKIALHKKLYQTVSEGDFMVKLNYYSTTPRIPIFGQAMVFDIIRFADDGKGAEHWDVAEEIANIEELGKLF